MYSFDRRALSIDKLLYCMTLYMYMCYAPFVTRSRLCLRQMGPARLCFAPPLSVRCPVCFRRFRRDPHGPFVSGARWLRSSCGFVLSRLCSIVTFIFRSLGGFVCE